MKNSIPLWVEFLGMGNGAWGRITNAQCPKSAGGYPSPPTRGWSFWPTFNKLSNGFRNFKE
ncbi:hypothetical protein [Nostoc sp.]|uniref:hypothetical protein n=1 Tax=Nostoc sp. TaxID=1180 RepID=UPI002FF51F24